MTAQVSLIISTHNRLQELLHTLPSLYACTSGDFEVIVVSAASTDGTNTEIPKRFPQVRLVIAPDVGWGESNNIGAAAATGEFLGFLGPDMEFQSGWLSFLQNGRSLPADLGSYGTPILRKYPTRTGTRDYLYLGYRIWNNSFALVDFVGPEQLREWSQNGVPLVKVDCVAYPVVPRPVFLRVGGFDPNYFYSNDEVDLAIRIRQLGFSNYATTGWVTQTDYTPDTTPKIRYFWAKNQLLRNIKFHDVGQLMFLLPLLGGVAAVRSVYYQARGDRKSAEALRKAILWNIRHFRQTRASFGKSFFP